MDALSQGVERLHAGDFEGAIAAFDQVIAVSPTAEAYCLRGSTRYELGDRQGALDDLHQSLRLNPALADSYYYRAVIQREMGSFKPALSDFQQAAECWQRQGNLERHDRTLHRIQELYRQGITASDSPAKTTIAEGLEQLKQGATLEAIASFSQAIEQDTTIADAYQLRGTIYLNQGEIKGAIADFTEALHRNPQLADAYYNRGCAYFDAQQLPAALEDFSQTITYDPYLAGAYYNRGSVLLGLGDREGAIANLKTAIHLLQQQGDQTQYEWVMNQLQSLQQA